MKLLMRYKGIGNAAGLKRDSFYCVEVVEVDSKSFSIAIRNNDMRQLAVRTYTNKNDFDSEWERIL